MCSTAPHTYRETAVLTFLFSVVVASGGALEPVTLEPATELEPRSLELSEQAIYAQHDADDEFSLRTELEYAFSPRLALRLALPATWSDDEDSVGDLSARLQLVLNPEATYWPIAAVSAELMAPTGEDSDELGGELGLRLSKPFGANGQHALHLNIAGGHFTRSGDEVRDLYYRLVAGYTFAATESTTLYADLVRRQLRLYGENENLLEVGLRQRLNETAALTFGLGAGLGDESPDWTVNAGLELRFSLGR